MRFGTPEAAFGLPSTGCRRLRPVIAALLLAGCTVPGADPGPSAPAAPGPPAGSAAPAASAPAATPSPAAPARAILGGTVYEPGAAQSDPGAAGGGVPGTFREIPAAGALVYVSTPEEAVYLGPRGGAIATTADAQGRYRLGVVGGKPLLVSAVLAGNRRLVGLATPAATGSTTADVSLAGTYVTEFLRHQAVRAGRSPADYDLGSLATATAAARDMLARGQLSPAPDLSPAAIPDLVDGYLVAMARYRPDVADLWAGLLGERPLAITTLEDSADAGFIPTGLAVDPGSGAVVVASFNSTGVAIRVVGRPDPVFRELAGRGFVQITALAPGPDGKMYFAERMDRRLGGAVDRTGAAPEIRLLRFAPAALPESGLAAVEELGLQVPPDLAPYMADAAVATHIEPEALAWEAGKLYLADGEASLIYEFSAPPGLATGSAWPGRLHAGRVRDGRPAKGNQAGPRLGGAAFDGLTSLLWSGGELFFSDAENSVVRAIDAAGTVRDVAGQAGERGLDGDGGPALAARFAYPQGLAIDAAGRLFVADGDNHRIRVIEAGRVRTIAGGGERARDGDARAAAIGQITRLALDARGNLLFNDVELAKVRILWLQNGI